MAAITTTVAAITNMARRRMEAVPLDAIVGQPNLHSVRHFVEQVSTFVSHFVTTKWGGKYLFLPLVLSKAKMRPSAGNNNLDCKQLKKPEIINPRTEDITQGKYLLQFQEDQQVAWQEYTFQEVVDSVAAKAIVAAVNAQCVKELKEDYVGYKNQTIKTLVTHLSTWYVITIK